MPLLVAAVIADNEPAVKLYVAKGLWVTRRYEKGGHTMLNMSKSVDPAA